MLGAGKTPRITALIRSLVANSTAGELRMDPVTLEAYQALGAFLHRSVYVNDRAKREERKVPQLIQSLYQYFLEPDHLPAYLRSIAETEGRERAAADYVAGMTDPYAVAVFQELYIPRFWSPGSTGGT